MNNGGNMLVTIGPLILLLIVMYFLLIRPQKKREKEINEMRRGINVGDEVITIGGICGKVVKTKNDTLILQVGADKVKFEVMRWSISKVVESAKKPAVSKPEPEEEAAEETKPARPKRLKKAAASEEETPAETADTEENAGAEEADKPAEEAAADEENK